MVKYLTFLSILLLPCSSSYAGKLIIGVLEQSQTAMCAGENPTPVIVHPLFGKLQDKWVALINKNNTKSFDFNKVNWTAAFDGKNIGRVASVESPRVRIVVASIPFVI